MPQLDTIPYVINSVTVLIVYFIIVYVSSFRILPRIAELLKVRNKINNINKKEIIIKEVVKDELIFSKNIVLKYIKFIKIFLNKR